MKTTQVMLALSVALSLAFACDEKPKSGTAVSATGEPTAAPVKTEETPAVAAYPPGMAPPEDAGSDAPLPEPKTGVCAFNESGYDGQDTKSNEKMTVKIKDDKIAAAEYSYRGSYALDGKTDQLSIPLVENKWLDFEMPMTSGTKKFQVKYKANVMAFKGTATQDKEASCQWEKPDKDKEKEKDKDAKSKAGKDKKK